LAQLNIPVCYILFVTTNIDKILFWLRSLPIRLSRSIVQTAACRKPKNDEDVHMTKAKALADGVANAAAVAATNALVAAKAAGSAAARAKTATTAAATVIWTKVAAVVEAGTPSRENVIAAGQGVAGGAKLVADGAAALSKHGAELAEALDKLAKALQANKTKSEALLATGNGAEVAAKALADGAAALAAASHAFNVVANAIDAHFPQQEKS
jgi:hypothetical protein